MEKLDVIFANRYLEAYHQYKHGKKPSASWNAAFRMAQNGKKQLILQHLLMGMNAHINLDLGIAAAESGSPDKIKTLHADFFAINKLLFDLVDEVKSDLECFSPRFRFIMNLLSNEDAILEFSISMARDAAWDFAQNLALESENSRTELIKHRDKESLAYAKLIHRPGLIGSLIIWWVRRKESQNVAGIISDLRNNYGHTLNFAKHS